MRIAYVSADLGVPVFGQKGCSIHVQEIVHGLLRQGADLDLFTFRGEGQRPKGLEEIRLHQLPLSSSFDLASREQAAWRANQFLETSLRAHGPFDFVYERYSIWSHAGMAYAQSIDIPGLLEVNAPLIEEQAQHRGLVNRALAEEVAERAFRDASSLIAVSEEVALYLSGFAAAKERVHVIPNGVHPDRFAKRAKKGRRSLNGFTIGFVGSFKPWHGLLDLIEAFAYYRGREPHARLLLVGDGPERPKLLEAIREQGLNDAVDLAGAVSPAEIPDWLASMDVAVAPYPDLKDFYFSPLKVYEYMAAGLPIVASRIGQLARLLEHEVSALLCTPGNPVALAYAFERLGKDEALRCRLGRVAQEHVRREHTWDRAVRRILDLAGCSVYSGQASKEPSLP
jgi:glycosyltransferase involved in cell wall biosynthesis